MNRNESIIHTLFIFACTMSLSCHTATKRPSFKIEMARTETKGEDKGNLELANSPIINRPIRWEVRLHIDIVWPFWLIGLI